MAARRHQQSGKGRREEPGVLTAPLAPGRLCGGLAVVAGVLILIHTGLAFFHYRVQELPWLLIQLFDVDQENNLPTWYSAFLLGLSAAFLWLVAADASARGKAWSGAWRVLSVGFLLMSLDEVAGVHETINSIIVPSWAIAGGIAAALLGVAFIPFLLHLPRRTAVLFAVSGAIFLAGATGLEIVGNEMVRQRLRETLRYSLTAALEESLEMAGVLLFLHTLLSYLRGEPGRALRTGIRVDS